MIASWTDVVGTMTASIGVAIGAVWSYWRLIRGRTFGARALVTAGVANAVAVGSQGFANIQVVVENAGAERLRLVPGATWLEISTRANLDLVALSIEEEQVRWVGPTRYDVWATTDRTDAFDPDSIEIDPGERASEVVTVRIPPGVVAIRAVLNVTGERRRRILENEVRSWKHVTAGVVGTQ